MLNAVTKADAGGREIFLVGTAHVSRESVDLVKKTIEEERPDVVAVELDEQRYDALKNKKKWDDTEFHKVLKEKKTQLFLLQLLLTNFQRRIGDRMGVRPGSEMLEAIRVAEEKNIKVALADRDVRVTLKRALSKMGLREKFSLLFGLFEGMFAGEEVDEKTLEKLKDGDVMTEMIKELAKQAPSAKKVLIDERDEYIAQKILACDGKKIVAVVGAGHVRGLKERIESGRKEDLRRLEEIPPAKGIWKLLGYSIPAIFILLLAWGFYSSGASLTLDMIVRWVLITGTFSAIGATAALAHPLSIAVAFLAAPFTTIHPALAAGWFSGLTEAYVRKPRVRDFDELFKLNTLRDYWRNGVTRILLVTALTNVGATLGTLVGLPYLATLLP